MGPHDHVCLVEGCHNRITLEQFRNGGKCWNCSRDASKIVIQPAKEGPVGILVKTVVIDDPVQPPSDEELKRAIQEFQNMPIGPLPIEVAQPKASIMALSHEFDPEFNQRIGELDFSLSVMMRYARHAAEGKLSEPNRQTMKHHAENMIAAGHAILKKLGKTDQTAQPLNLRNSWDVDPPDKFSTTIYLLGAGIVYTEFANPSPANRDSDFSCSHPCNRDTFILTRDEKKPWSKHELNQMGKIQPIAYLLADKSVLLFMGWVSELFPNFHTISIMAGNLAPNGEEFQHILIPAE